MTKKKYHFNIYYGDCDMIKYITITAHGLREAYQLVIREIDNMSIGNYLLKSIELSYVTVAESEG